MSVHVINATESGLVIVSAQQLAFLNQKKWHASPIQGGPVQAACPFTLG